MLQASADWHFFNFLLSFLSHFNICILTDLLICVFPIFSLPPSVSVSSSPSLDPKWHFCLPLCLSLSNWLTASTHSLFFFCLVHFTLTHRKSTFFNVLTKSQAAAENFPFCTIDPNESRVPVPDPRFDYLVNYFQPDRWVVCLNLPINQVFGLLLARILAAIRRSEKWAMDSKKERECVCMYVYTHLHSNSYIPTEWSMSY